MSQIIEVKVPDIGNFKDVPIIDVLVKVGDTVKAEDALLTLESDKATIDIPSPADGVIAELTVKVGDKVSEGSLVARITGGTAEKPAASASQPAPAPDASAPPAGDTAAQPATAATPTQIAQIVDQEFPTYDGDANGELNAEEFGAWMKKLRTALPVLA